eukprot:8819330-Heterocapsa_arctica.AAC.1
MTASTSRLVAGGRLDPASDAKEASFKASSDADSSMFRLTFWCRCPMRWAPSLQQSHAMQ